MCLFVCAFLYVVANSRVCCALRRLRCQEESVKVVGRVSWTNRCGHPVPAVHTMYKYTKLSDEWVCDACSLKNPLVDSLGNAHNTSFPLSHLHMQRM